MGILDEKPAVGEAKRRAVLRAAIKRIARERQLSHSDAVAIFAEQIERSKYTVYGWLTAGQDGKGSQRPMPLRHYERLVEHGLLDPTAGDDSQ